MDQFRFYIRLKRKISQSYDVRAHRLAHFPPPPREIYEKPSESIITDACRLFLVMIPSLNRGFDHFVQPDRALFP